MRKEIEELETKDRRVLSEVIAREKEKGQGKKMLASGRGGLVLANDDREGKKNAG